MPRLYRVAGVLASSRPYPQTEELNAYPCPKPDRSGDDMLKSGFASFWRNHYPDD